jgi:Redoxin
VSILEKAANVGIVFVCCAVVADIGYRHFGPQPPPAETSTAATRSNLIQYKVGETVEQIPGLTSQPGTRSLLFVVRSTCPYCTRSMDFYQRVVQQARSEHAPVQLVGVCLEPADVCEHYFKTHHLTMDRTVGVDIGSIKVTGTPTLLMVDDAGKVTSVWTGALSPAREQTVLAAIAQKAGNS